MARIDTLLERLKTGHATRSVLVADAPAHVEQADGTVKSGSLISGEQLNALLDEVLPPEARAALDAGGAANFTYEAPAGRFIVTARREGESLTVEITPETPFEPQASTDADSTAYSNPEAAPADTPATAPAPAPFSADVFAADPVASPGPTNYPQQGYPQAGQVPEAANTSGAGAAAEVPLEIRGFNWGGLFLSWIWAVGNKSWIGLLGLVPIIGFFVRFYLGFRGNEMAWRNKRWASIDAFRNTQRTWAIIGLVIWVCSGLLLPIFGAILFPVFARARENARKSVCQNNEKQIMLGVMMFTQDHDEKLPKSTTADGLKSELAEYVKAPQVWECPSQRGAGAGYDVNPRTAGVSIAEIASPATTPIIWDKQPDHLDGRNVGFADGHVKWFREEAFQAQVKLEADNFVPVR